jgi:hypothetical protein
VVFTSTSFQTKWCSSRTGGVHQHQFPNQIMLFQNWWWLRASF